MIQVKIEGLNEVLKAIHDEPEKINKKIRDGLKEIEDIVKEDSKKNAPEDTGRLINSIEAKLSENNSVKNKDFLAEIYVDSNSAAGAYANYMHEGHYKLRHRKPGAGRKFIERAVEKNVHKIEQILQTQLDAVAREWET